MIALRKRHQSLMKRQFLTGERIENKSIADISWHSKNPDQTPWEDSDLRSLAFILAGVEEGESDLYVIMNMSEHYISFALPAIDNKRWQLSVDTSLQSPNDIVPPSLQQHWSGHYNVEAKSVVVFENTPD